MRKTPNSFGHSPVTNPGFGPRAPQVMVLILRLAMGWLMLGAGIDKLTAGNFSASGYLKAATGPLAGFFHRLASDTALLGPVDALVIWGEILIGSALVLGLLVRFASFWGAVMMVLYYLPRLPGVADAIAQQVIYALVFILFMFTGSGYFLGIDFFFRGLETRRHWLRILFG